MTPFPHRYEADAQGTAVGAVRVATPNAPALQTHAPVEFGGPEGYWSPETLLVAAVADCYVLSFRATARACKLEWDSLDVHAEGVLERVDGVTKFTRFRIVARLQIRHAEQRAKADVALNGAQRTCLISNSLTAPCVLESEVLEAEAGLVA